MPDPALNAFLTAFREDWVKTGPPTPQVVIAMVHEIERLREMLRECADDLEAELNDRHRNRDGYATIMDRWERDMDPVRRARELLQRRH